MDRKNTFWNTPISILDTKKEKWSVILFLSVFIPLFLIIFQPFGVNNYDPTHRINPDLLIGAIGFGFVNGFTIGIYEFIITPYLFKKKTVAEHFVRLFLLLIILSSAIYLFYNIIGSFHDWKWSSYFGFIRDISLMSVIPIGLIILYANYKKTKNAYEILLEQPKFNVPEKTLIKLESDNGKDSISIALNALLYIEAQDNYVSVHYLMDNQVKKQLLRITMKALESNLKDMAIVRCHRSYLVNINKVTKAKGDGHQMKLYVSNIVNPIPVSRSYISSLKEIMATYHK